eukprot:TRINITY_DN3908_c0_g1_i1.p1 TRINITY_DN3908_c0_g1~~TRINITY_DN3908_c0_g1_i1.p1  ORF type:complete len:133 (-),score=15.87 TRINITY_DN3908_c0_g1_i1:34-384(-)
MAKQIECRLEMIDGRTHTMQAQLVWNVAKLRERIEVEMGIPCYAQVISDANKTLLSTDTLSDVYSGQDSDDSCLSLVLVCASLPGDFGEAEFSVFGKLSVSTATATQYLRSILTTS